MIKIDKLSGILGGVVYPMFMLPAMGFLLIQVYQINARSSADHESLVTNEKRITIIEQNVLTHLIGHNQKTDKQPAVGLPLIHFKERRNAIRPE